MRRERGSAYIFVLIMIVAMTIVILATAESSISYVLTEKRIEDRVRADYALRGAIVHVDALRTIQKIPNPYSDVIQIGGVACSVTAQPSSRASGSLLVDASCQVAGRTYKKTAYVGTNRPNIYYYALAIKNGYNSTQDMEVGKSAIEPGHVFVGGNFNLTIGTIRGDVDARGTASAPNGGLLGNLAGNVLDDLFGSISFLDYLLAANTVHLLNRTENGYTFPAVASTAPYYLTYVGGNLNLKGDIDGQGTFYVNGNFDTDGRVKLRDGAKLFVIVNGNARIDEDFEGYVFVKGNLTLAGSPKVTGGLYTQGTLLPGGMKLEFDPRIARFPDEGVRHRAPGL